MEVQHQEGVYLLQGNVSTSNNGGFVRMTQEIQITTNDLTGIRFMAKGNNETYEVHATTRGIKVPPFAYFSQEFTVTNEWQEFKINFKDFKRALGYSARSIKPQNIKNISFAGYGRDFPVELYVKDVSLINET